MGSDQELMTAEVLRFILDYEPNSGVFRWKVHVGGKCRQGQVAGCKTTHSKGYVVIRIFGKRYLAHRLAFLWVYGYWPSSVDHINGDKQDNRIANLREVTASQNVMNTKLRKDNRAKSRGVYRIGRRGKYGASISIQGKSIWLGTFHLKSQATDAYKKASKQFHGEYARKE